MLKAQLPPCQEVMPLDTVAYCAAGAVAQVSGLEGCVVFEHFARWDSLESFPALRSALRKATLTVTLSSSPFMAEFGVGCNVQTNN